MSEHASTKLLNLATGFAAMQEFLEAYWERGDRTSEDLAALLGSLEIDPAQRADWADAVNRVLGSKARPSRKAIQFMSSRPSGIARSFRRGKLLRYVDSNRKRRRPVA
jgi:hypothetical protein